MTQPAKLKRQFARMPNTEPAPGSAASLTLHNALAQQSKPTAATPVSKAARTVMLMQRSGGASLDEMVAATGWMPHTIRAALTRLRKKGHTIVKSKDGGVTRYTLPAAPQS